MKYLIALICLFLAPEFAGAQQAVTFSYSLDTFKRGGGLRTDSMYLIETTTGALIQSGIPVSSGSRDQTFQNPVFLSDTAQLTDYYRQLRDDSITLMRRAAVMQAQAAVAGAKYRAVKFLADSVLYGITGAQRSISLPPQELPQAPAAKKQAAPQGKKQPAVREKQKAVTGRKKKQ